MSETMQLAIVEDDPVVMESLQTYFEFNRAINVVLSATSVEAFWENVDQLPNAKIDIILLDIGLPGQSGLEAIAKIKMRFEAVDIVMFTTYEEEEKIFKALCDGACSYITKRTSLSKLQEALYIIHRGGSYMSPSIARKVVQHFVPKKTVVKQEGNLTVRQLEIVEGIVEGLSYKMVADKLGIGIETVRDHIKKIYKSLHVHSKAELIKKKLDGKI